MKSIKLGGKLRPIHFGWYSFKIFEQETGIPFTKLRAALQEANVEILVVFVYSAICGGYNKLSKEVDFEKNDIYNWMDDYSGDINELFELLIASLPANLAQINKKKAAIMKKK